MWEVVVAGMFAESCGQHFFSGFFQALYGFQVKEKLRAS